MITVEEAKSLINEQLNALALTTIEIHKSLGYTLAEDIIAPISLPPFQQSAMDGYAIASSDEKANSSFQLIGEIKAGDSPSYSLKEGEAVRIFTGGMVPEGTTSVIMQEKTETIGQKVLIKGEIVTGSNIRPIGEQITAGELALKKGTLLSPAAIGFLIGFGLTTVQVYRKPKVGLIVTGNELAQAGESLKEGQIYESNSYALTAALQQIGIHVEKIIRLQDDLSSTINSIKEMIAATDLTILTGGISVGDYDFVGKALQEIDVQQIFYKVKQKPGKPLYFGKKDGCYLFALPGNPAAALVCFYQYVLTALDLMSGKPSSSIEKRKLKLTASYLKKGDRAQFLKALTKGQDVELLGGQNSSMLHSFASADALVYIPAHKNELKIGESVDVFMLP